MIGYLLLQFPNFLAPGIGFLEDNFKNFPTGVGTQAAELRQLGEHSLLLGCPSYRVALFLTDLGVRGPWSPVYPNW